MKKFVKILKKRFKNAHINLSSDVYLMQGNFGMYFLYELKRLFSRMQKEQEFSIHNFKVRARIIINREVPNNYKELWESEYSFRKQQETFLNIIDEEPDFLQSYLSETDFSELNEIVFLSRYDAKKEKKINNTQTNYDSPNFLELCIEQAKKYAEKRNGKIKAKIIGSYLFALGILDDTLNQKERTKKLSELIGIELTSSKHIEEPTYYRKNLDTPDGVKDNLVNLKLFFERINFKEVYQFIKEDISSIEREISDNK